MFRFSMLLLLNVAVIMVQACEQERFDFSSKALTIVSNGDKSSVKFADRLFAQLAKRSSGKNLRLKRSDAGLDDSKTATIYVEVVSDLDFDYEIRNEAKYLAVFAKDLLTADWLLYALIDRIAQDQPDVNVSDLPPSTLTFGSEQKRFAMTYRDPHFAPNLDTSYTSIWGTHNVDRDWGLWGHSLNKVFKDVTDDNTRALAHGKRTTTQFCFSSPETYHVLRDYIAEQYGDGSQQSTRFMLAPNDNDLVCTCDECCAAGNTESSATVALMVLMNKLAIDFPKHAFFALAYRTTERPTSHLLENNTGVLLSTIGLPKTVGLDSNDLEVQRFMKLAAAWKAKTAQLILWDYNSNFDDYLTPYPSLYYLQRQLLFYQKLGVTGLFLNGSGYDYSPFDDVKTYVMAALLREPSVSVDTLIQRYMQRFYPASSQLLTAYYLGMEKQVFAKKMELPVYASFREAKETYFDEEKFSVFYDRLKEKLAHVDGAEKIKLGKLFTALSYTKLQTLYTAREITENTLVTSANVADVFEALERYKTYLDLRVYKEDAGSLLAYTDAWRKLQKRPTRKNALADTALTVKSATSVKETYLLTDSKSGFEHDFNQGWWLNAEDVELTTLLNKPGTQELTIRFLVNAQHRMLPPEEISVWLDNECVACKTSETLEQKRNLAKFSCALQFEGQTEMRIVIKKNKQIKNSVIACDEIQLN